jgi:exodeoxyribonuclease VII large subunit
VVARAIFASRLPVVSGVGHETDFSIADFVADLRAATPTAAAVAASPDRAALAGQVALLRRRLARDLRRIVETGAQRLDAASRRLLTPAQRLAHDRERLAQHARRLRRALPDVERAGRDLERLARRLAAAATRGAVERARHLAALRASLSHLDPTRVLGRGYSIVRGADGHVVRSSAAVARGDAVDIMFSEGGASAIVQSTREPGR